MSFTLAFVLANGSYVWPVLSDPLGWGWNLLGTADVPWTPYLSTVRPIVQTTVLLGGLLWAGVTTRRLVAANGHQQEAMRQVGPVVLFQLAITMVLLWLLVA
jgi:hypothetical protein